MTLEQYMREIWLMNKQYGQEEELYPLINMLLRDGANTEKLSIRDVRKGQRIKEENKKHVESRKYIDGFGSFPDLAIFGERFPEGQEPKNGEKAENTILKNIYGCVEAKCIDSELIDSKLLKCLDHNIMKIGPRKENPKEEEKDYYVQIYTGKAENNYYVQINTEKGISLMDDQGKGANDAGQLLGELLWYGKVLYTNGLIWKYYKLSELEELEKNQETINDIRGEWIIADRNKGDTTSPDGKNPHENWDKERKTWIFEQCKKPLKIISKNIGDLTKIYNKIKDETSIPAFNEFDLQDYQEWKNFKTNLATIDWTEDIFWCNRNQ